MNNVLVVVVTQASTQLLVVHLGLVLARTPQSRHLIGVRQLELPTVATPADAVAVLVVQQQLEKKLPQLNRTTSC